MNAAFWNGRRVFVTGHTGFKGAWLSLWLQRLGARVTGYALDAPSRPSVFESARVAEGIRDVRGDVLDRAHLDEALAASGAEIVIHLAAQSLVRSSYADPVGTYATNVLGTVHVLDAVRRLGCVRAVVSVTSDKCYENREWIWGYREDEAMGGFDPYSSSKGCAELAVASFRRSFFEGGAVAVASARAGNVVGGGDWAEDRLVPDAMRAFLAGQPLEIRNPAAVRPWQHVLEPLSGYLALAERLYEQGPHAAGAWNFGPEEADTQPVSAVADALAAKWGRGAAWRLATGSHPHEARMLRLDISKARQRLAWRPRWDLDAALDRIVAWHQAAAEGADLRAVTMGQIEEYSQS